MAYQNAEVHLYARGKIDNGRLTAILKELPDPFSAVFFLNKDGIEAFLQKQGVMDFVTEFKHHVPYPYPTSIAQLVNQLGRHEIHSNFESGALSYMSDLSPLGNANVIFNPGPSPCEPHYPRAFRELEGDQQPLDGQTRIVAIEGTFNTDNGRRYHGVQSRAALNYAVPILTKNGDVSVSIVIIDADGECPPQVYTLLDFMTAFRSGFGDTSTQVTQEQAVEFFRQLREEHAPSQK